MTLAQSDEQAAMGDGDDGTNTSVIVLDGWMVALEDANSAQRSQQSPLTDDCNVEWFQRSFIHIFCLFVIYFMMRLMTQGKVQMNEACVEEWPDTQVTSIRRFEYCME